MQLDVTMRFTREEISRLAEALQPFHLLFPDNTNVVSIGELGPQTVLDVWKVVQLLHAAGSQGSYAFTVSRLKHVLVILDALRTVTVREACAVPHPDWIAQTHAALASNQVPVVADPINMVQTIAEIRSRQIRAIDAARPLLTNAIQQLYAVQQLTTIVSTAMIAHAT